MPRTADIAEMIAALIDAIEDEYGTEPEIGAVGVVVEVHPAPGVTEIRVECTAEQAWIQAGLFGAARLAAERALRGK